MTNLSAITVYPDGKIIGYRTFPVQPRFDFTLKSGFKMRVLIGVVPGGCWHFRVKSYPNSEHWTRLKALALHLCLDFSTYAGPMSCYLRLRRTIDVERLHEAMPDSEIEEFVRSERRPSDMLFHLGEGDSIRALIENNPKIVSHC